MPWEESRERLAQRRFAERHQPRGIQREDAVSIRAGVQPDIRANGRFSDQSGVPLWGLFYWGALWGGEG